MGEHLKQIYLSNNKKDSSNQMFANHQVFSRKRSKGTQGTATLFVSHGGEMTHWFLGNFHLRKVSVTTYFLRKKWYPNVKMEIYRLICKSCQNIANTQNMHKLNLFWSPDFFGGEPNIPKEKNTQNPFPKDSLFDHQHPRPSPSKIQLSHLWWSWWRKPEGKPPNDTP